MVSKIEKGKPVASFVIRNVIFSRDLAGEVVRVSYRT